MIVLMGLSGSGFGPMGVVNWFDCSQERYYTRVFHVSTPGCFMYLHQGVSCILVHRYFVYLQSTACYNRDVTLALQMGILGRREGEMM